MSILDTNITILKVNQETINKPFEVGYRGDHNAYKLVFSDLVGEGYSVLFWKPMSKPCIVVPLVNNEWLLGNEVLSTSGTLYCQVVKKDESNNFIKHSQVFMLSVNESAPCTQQAFEEVPPNFQITYDEMVAITKKVNESLASGKFNGLSAYELAVKNGFEGSEQEWVESLKYWNSPEFTKLAEQVRADKTHVDTVVAEFNKKAETVNADFDEKVKTANDSFDKKVTDADTNFVEKVSKANTDLDTKVAQINKDLDTKETAINQALDTKIDNANQTIDTKVQESVTSAEKAKQSELKAQQTADNIQGLSNTFRIDTSEQGRVISVADSSDSKLNGIKVFGESTQSVGEGNQLFDKSTVRKYYVVSDTNGSEMSYGLNDNASDWISVAGMTNIICSKTTSHAWGAFYDESKTFISGITNYGKQISVPSNAHFVKFTVVSDVLDTFMVNEGTELKPYEPYTNRKPAPTPENASQIVNKLVKSITFTGKNLLKETTYKYNSQYSYISSNELVPEILKTLKPYTIYTAFIYGINFILRDIKFCDINATNGSTFGGTFRGKTSVVFGTSDLKKVTNNVIYIRPLEKLTESQIAQLSNLKIMIIEGNHSNVELSYAPFVDPQIVTLTQPVTLNGIPVEKDGNVTIDGKQYISDVITQKGGVYGVERNVNYQILNNNSPIGESAITETSTRIFFSVNNLKPYSVLKKQYLLSNIFNVISNDLSYKGNEGIHLRENDSQQICVSLSKSRNITTTSDFLNFLTEHNCKVYYVLNSSTFEPLPEADQQALKALKSNYPSTVVSNNDNAFMQLDYVADTKNYIDNKLAEIKTAIIASKGV